AATVTERTIVPEARTRGVVAILETERLAVRAKGGWSGGHHRGDGGQLHDGSRRWCGRLMLDTDDGHTALRDGFRRSPDGIVLGVDVAHEHRHRLMSGECHADLYRHAGVGDVGRGAMTDAVRADVGKLRALQDSLPALVVG